jgi:hypothetical protein
MTLTLTQATTNIRTDLNDLDNTNYRWLDTTIQREIDRAVAKYSAVSPVLTSTQLNVVAGSRIYPVPAGAWWVDRVEFPVGNYPRAFVPFTLHPKSDGTSELELDLITAPQDTTQLIEIVYAGKHTLDTNGTTIPERHHDAIYLGAEAYLVQQWLGNVNDNFEYVDGQFRDRVDDTVSAQQWMTTYTDLNRQWETRIRQIAEETNAAITVFSRWGDKPYRWDRL